MIVILNEKYVRKLKIVPRHSYDRKPLVYLMNSNEFTSPEIS